MKIEKSFTLAETFIAITILGIVAVLTVPSLIQKQKERVLISQLKNAYSTLSTAVDEALVMHRDEEWGEYSFQKFVAPYLSVKRDCSGQFRSHCTPVEDYQDMFPGYENKAFWFPCRDGNLDSTTCYRSKLILKNDVIVYVRDYKVLTETQILVDVNGAKGPNRYNVDVFDFWFSKEKGLFPAYGGNGAGAQDYTQYVLQNGNMNYLKR